MNERIEEIRRRAQRISVSSGWENFAPESGRIEVEAFQLADQDVFYLISQIEHLEHNLEREREVAMEFRRADEW